jgi:hypothetical protein
VFVFEDGVRMALSSYQTGDDEWDFYAVAMKDDLTLDHGNHHIISPSDDYEKMKRKNLFLDKE